MSRTAKNISNEMEEIVKINWGLWFILNLAINDSRVPTTIAKRTWTPMNIGME